jgi:hypothetical protein
MMHTNLHFSEQVPPPTLNQPPDGQAPDQASPYALQALQTTHDASTTGSTEAPGIRLPENILEDQPAVPAAGGQLAVKETVTTVPVEASSDQATPPDSDASPEPPTPPAESGDDDNSGNPSSDGSGDGNEPPDEAPPASNEDEPERHVPNFTDLTQPQHLGSTIKFDRQGVLVESFEEGHVLWAKTAGDDGTVVPLPYTYYRERSVRNPDTQPAELYDAQPEVEYSDLSEEQKAAVETAIRLDEESLLSADSPEYNTPEYRRLALLRSDQPGEPDQIHTMKFRDGFNRRMHIHPADPSRSDGDPEIQLDRPVTYMETVHDGFMVVPNNGDYLTRATYRDAEVNFFGPPVEAGWANAFLITGNPRHIHAEGDPRLVEHDWMLDRDEPRYTIVPIRFYKVLTAESDNVEKPSGF